MQEILRIGNDLVPANKEIKDIGNTSVEITKIAEKYKTDVLAIIGKGEEYNLVAQHHEEKEYKLEKDIAKIISAIESISDLYEVDSKIIANVIKEVIDA